MLLPVHLGKESSVGCLLGSGVIMTTTKIELGVICDLWLVTLASDLTSLSLFFSSQSANNNSRYFMTLTEDYRKCSHLPNAHLGAFDLCYSCGLNWGSRWRKICSIFIGISQAKSTYSSWQNQEVVVRLQLCSREKPISLMSGLEIVWSNEPMVINIISCKYPVLSPMSPSCLQFADKKSGCPSINCRNPLLQNRDFSCYFQFLSFAFSNELLAQKFFFSCFPLWELFEDCEDSALLSVCLE